MNHSRAKIPRMKVPPPTAQIPPPTATTPRRIDLSELLHTLTPKPVEAPVQTPPQPAAPHQPDDIRPQRPGSRLDIRV